MAAFSLASAALGFVCLWGLGGLIGISLGILARGEIERSNGRLKGNALAGFGIGLGILNLVATVAVIFGLAAWIASEQEVVRPSLPAPTTPTPPPPSFAGPARPAERVSREDQLSVTQVGSLILTDIGPGVESLREELAAQQDLAHKHGKRVLLWLVVPKCKPCNGVAVALPEPEMQEALASVRLVRVNVLDFAGELQHLNIPTEKIPGFALLGANNRPVDYVHGGEWDADVAKNISPVLGKFVRGNYNERRDRWRGGEREDETAL